MTIHIRFIFSLMVVFGSVLEKITYFSFNMNFLPSNWF